MPICTKCGRDVCHPCAVDENTRNVSLSEDQWKARVTLASDAELSRKSHYLRLAVATAELGKSRRDIPDWLADVIYGFEGIVLWPDGAPFIVTDTLVDDAFNNDGSFRWLSRFVQFRERAPRQRPQARILDRLRLIDLAFKISDPGAAVLISR